MTGESESETGRGEPAVATAAGEPPRTGEQDETYAAATPEADVSGREPGLETWVGEAEPGVEPGELLSGSGGPYVILLSSHKHRSAAEWEAARVEARGIPVVIVEAEVPDRGTWYRIALVGGHRTLASARAALDIIRELGYEGAWLTYERENG